MSPPTEGDAAGATRAFGPWHATGERRAGGQSTVLRVRGSRGQEGALKLAHDNVAAARALGEERTQLAAVLARDGAAAEWLAVPHDHGETEAGTPWLVLPWFPHSLRSWLDAEAPPLADRLEALRQAVEAVCRLHETGPSRGQPRLHHDLKPDNFLVGGEPGERRVVLADLGGARVDDLATPGQPLAGFTPRYAPPEVVFGLDARPEASLDAFAMAVVIYQGITGLEPRSVCDAWPLTDEGAELLQLAGAAPTEAGLARLAALRARPLGALLVLSEMASLTGRDESRLRNDLQDLLGVEGTSAPERAEKILEPLLPALRRALDPDPAHRAGDLRQLAAALELALRVCGVGRRVVAPEAVGGVGATSHQAGTGVDAGVDVAAHPVTLGG